MIKELLLGSAVLFCAGSIANGQENIKNPCLCVEKTPTPSEKAPYMQMQWMSRADCRSKKGFQCDDECQCKVSNNDDETDWVLRDYCNSRQTKGYCIDDKCLKDNVYYQDDTSCPCSNSQGTDVICMNSVECGTQDEPFFKSWGKCTDQCYCKPEGCKAKQDCYVEVGWTTKKECWSKGYLCSVEEGIEYIPGIGIERIGLQDI